MAELPRLAPPEQLRSLADLAACLPAPAWAPHVAQVRPRPGRPAAALHTLARPRAPAAPLPTALLVAGWSPSRGAPEGRSLELRTPCKHACTARGQAVDALAALAAGGDAAQRAGALRALARLAPALAAPAPPTGALPRALSAALRGACDPAREVTRGPVCSQASARLVGRALRPCHGRRTRRRTVGRSVPRECAGSCSLPCLSGAPPGVTPNTTAAQRAEGSAVGPTGKGRAASAGQDLVRQLRHPRHTRWAGCRGQGTPGGARARAHAPRRRTPGSGARPRAAPRRWRSRRARRWRRRPRTRPRRPACRACWRACPRTATPLTPAPSPPRRAAGRLRRP